MMKRLIRWALNRIPRPMLQRMAGWAVPLAGLLYKGRGAVCPVCGARYRRFMPYGYVHSRSNALCPNCLSLERHRLLWLYLSRETELLQNLPRTLQHPHTLGHQTSTETRAYTPIDIISDFIK